MKLVDLKRLVSEHTGGFYLRRAGGKCGTKCVSFKHVYNPPIQVDGVPDVGALKEFYETFGSLTLYVHKDSGDAAFYIASPDQWDELTECLRDWADLDDEPELLPDWLDNCIAIGEIPQSGNYLLVPTIGAMAGHISEFEHDGFEFIDHASNIKDFVIKMLKPDSAILTHMASHMAFIEGNPMVQWWIEEMRDNNGLIVKTDT